MNFRAYPHSFISCIRLGEYGELDALEIAGRSILQREGLAPARESDGEATHPVRVGVGHVREADRAYLNLNNIR